MMNFRYRKQTNAWPGFVDLFSNLVIILIFLLIMFVFLWTTTSVFNKNTGVRAVNELKQVNAQQAERIQEMTEYKQNADKLLLMARDELESVDKGTEDLITAYEGRLNDLQSDIDELTTQLNQMIVARQNADAIEAERKKLQDDMGMQRATLSQQLAELQAALTVAEAKVAEQEMKVAEQEVKYVEMSNKLNKALADKVAELNDMSKYQSDFYRAVRVALGDDVSQLQADGDRFIINSDILFNSGSYTISKQGKEQLRVVADIIKDMETKIPSDVNWIVRVDGHTDNKQVISGTRAYKNNTQLSMLRASAVVDELVKDGVSKMRLLPSGFGDMYPVASGNDADSLRKNRRIELQLTNR